MSWFRRRTARIAALTMVRDEAEMLPRWLAYYGDQLGADQLVVVDHGSTDGSTDDLPCRVIRDPDLGEVEFERGRMRYLSSVATDLLRTHDAVLFTDCDEFLLPDPSRYEGLVDLVSRRRDDVIAGIGFNLVHRFVGPSAEAPLDPARPVLEQRRNGFVIPRLSKPSIKRVPAGWRFASHGINTRFAPSADALLLHLKYADADLLRTTGDRRRAIHASTGLGPKSAWAKSGDELVAELEAVLADRPEPHELDLASLDVSGLVHQRGEAWETTGLRELVEMQEGELVRLPDRFRGLV
ncbi:glycosyltransferase family 2 protein [Nocardioides sp. Kera G14]|uniref:glycosyltransferase family 2 protein n=1 Tax=Nocardioides sp. Kera G14 TaxID=2884264 RepID=UPI001D0FA54E|nr:glycosyltransferase family 2 protein [Nocardioides sp. Kera G14]UDY24551.1 glycosyltransferase family 2 protein [Nocardioides sp. Kera G14]